MMVVLLLCLCVCEVRVVGWEKNRVGSFEKCRETRILRKYTDGSKTEAGIRIVDSITWDGYDKSNGSTGNVVIVNLKKTNCVSFSF